jgi:thioredoxin-dependent peroxiredoxin
MSLYLLRLILLAGLVTWLALLVGVNPAQGRDEKKLAPGKVEEGKPAPHVDLQATQIDKVLPDKKDAGSLDLNAFKGKKNVVLFFYPKAMTSGCTKESCGFRDRMEDLSKYDTVVIGISTDKLDAQKKFTDKESLNFPLFADPDKKVTKAFGVLNANGMAMRWTFIIDKDGVVRKIYSKVNPATHPDEVLEYVKKNFGK